jgi:Sulfotransferase family
MWAKVRDRNWLRYPNFLTGKYVKSLIPATGRRNTNEDIIHVVGSQKSGTTWLRDCLDVFRPFCKPEWYFPELIEQVETWANTYGSSIPPEDRSRKVRAIAVSARRELLGACRGEKSAYPCVSLFSTVRADLHPRAVSILKETFPNSKVAVIVRDPRAVYNSLCHYLDGFRPGSSSEINVERFAIEWARQNRRWASSDPSVVVLYEELKQNFTATLDEVLSKMDIPHDFDDLRRTRALVFSVDNLRPKQPEIYRTGTIDEWREKLGAEVVRQIVDGAGETMSFFGYSLD